MDDILVTFVDVLIKALYVALLARVILSWIPVGRDSPFFPIVTMVYQATEPILGPIRRLLPNFGGFDFSPLVVLLLLNFIQRIFDQALA
ncbi:MAG: YggT family protein [SAR202 cluster bacterium]|nr:YggT family protein [SAR202 cluster bacterium]